MTGGAGVVAVLRALGIGDLLTAVPAIRAVRAALPGHRLVVATPGWLAELLPLIGGIDAHHPACGLRPLRWPPPPPETAVNLHGRGPASHAVLRAVHPARLIAFAHPDHPGIEGPRWNPAEHEVSRWCRLVGWYGMAARPDDLDLLPPQAPSPAPGAVVIHPGAAHGGRRWPARRFAAVARARLAMGDRVVITGSRSETGLAGAVAAAAGVGGGDVLAGRLTLGRLAAVTAHARLVICNDTGIAHLATGYRVPSVVLFGPTPPALWGPPPQRGQHVALWAGRPGNPFAEVPGDGLVAIGVSDVLGAAETALSPERAAQGGAAVPSPTPRPEPQPPR